MNPALALRYRPRTWSDITGQRTVRAVLTQMIKTGDIPPALLFTGSRGTGKTTTARILAASLNCPAEVKPCGQCAVCVSIFDGSSTDVLEIDAASNGLVDDIRAIRQAVLYATSAAWRVVMLDEAHSMSREAFNALLKVLEEPPDQTVFVLLTTEPGRILGTVASRCMSFEFRRIPPADIAARLAYIASAESLKATPELLAHIAERANGGLRDAVMTLDQVSRVGVATIAQFQMLMAEADIAPALLGRLVTGDLAGAYGLLDDHLCATGDAHGVSTALVALLRDLLVLQGGGLLTCQGQPLADRCALATKLDAGRVFVAMRALWDLKTRVRVTDDARSMIELAFVVMADALGSITVGAPAVPAAPRKMTLADLQAATAG